MCDYYESLTKSTSQQSKISRDYGFWLRVCSPHPSAVERLDRAFTHRQYRRWIPIQFPYHSTVLLVVQTVYESPIKNTWDSSHKTPRTEIGCRIFDTSFHVVRAGRNRVERSPYPNVWIVCLGSVADHPVRFGSWRSMGEGHQSGITI